MDVKPKRKSSGWDLVWMVMGTVASLLMSWLFPHFIRPWTVDSLQMAQNLMPVIIAVSFVGGLCILFMGIGYFTTRTIYFTLAATILFASPLFLKMKLNADSATRTAFTTTAEHFEPLIANIGKPSSGTSTDQARNAMREIISTIPPRPPHSGPDGETK